MRAIVTNDFNRDICDIPVGMKLIVLILDDVFDTSMTVLLDTFVTSNELAAAQGFDVPPCDVKLVCGRSYAELAIVGVWHSTRRC